MLATVRSATLVGVWGHPVSVEVHVADGLPGFTVVGLPDASCREARDRVRAAIVSSELHWPMKRVTVNLAPMCSTPVLQRVEHFAQFRLLRDGVRRRTKHLGLSRLPHAQKSPQAV